MGTGGEQRGVSVGGGATVCLSVWPREAEKAHEVCRHSLTPRPVPAPPWRLEMLSWLQIASVLGQSVESDSW